MGHVWGAVYPWNLITSIILLLAALLLDYLYPYHSGFLLKIHPVHTCFSLSKKMIKPYASRLYGVFLALTCIMVHLAPIYIVLYSTRLLGGLTGLTLWFITALWVMKTSVSIKLLLDIGYHTYYTALKGEWSETRYWVQQMVRRNVYVLDNEHVLSAAIESLAESLVDGFTSPLTYYPFLGVIGPFLQRLVNTLDGSVGFKTPELRRLGWFSARFDTVLNYVPARLTALYIVLASILLGYDWRNAWKILSRDHNVTESVNAGYPMSAIAGALRVRLEKPGYYSLGDALEPLSPSKVLDAIRIVKVSTIMHLLVVLLLLTLFYSCIHPIFS